MKLHELRKHVFSAPAVPEVPGVPEVLGDEKLHIVAAAAIPAIPAKPAIPPFKLTEKGARAIYQAVKDLALDSNELLKAALEAKVSYPPQQPACQSSDRLPSKGKFCKGKFCK